MTQITSDWAVLKKCSRQELITQLALHYQTCRTVGAQGSQSCRFILTTLEENEDWTLEEILSLLESVSPYIDPARSSSFREYRERALSMSETAEDLMRALKFIPHRQLRSEFDRVVSVVKTKDELAELVREYFLRP